ncbi:uncharacterized protein F5Z01DRAFT_654991 [Emericellopsis atlantica]|uniref:Uncharacterized protein n=1 Tax=Emericellopsis atlantica TaxID=2614577 RepID=A0A9P8CQ33_9HYPO|nr:uncharacterized protein F5Z01DRAFT_654991 [Emericellopsis atlantica]KAG9254862.1 hypothetical protein F5Z01DRAFT_654991 [Emericellopsis atlantica]
MRPTLDPRDRSVAAAPSHDNWTTEQHMDYGGPGTALQDDETRSFAVGEPLHQPPRSWASHLRAWAPEIGCILLAVGLFVALTVVLDRCNDKRLPQWPLGLTLNTAVALLATLCRSIIMLPVADAISQFKWNWFASGHHPIKDLYIFDQASRGPWGSLRLLGRMRGRLTPLSHAAALVLVSGVATSFLTQSAVSYEERLVTSAKSGNATISRASMFPSTVDDNSTSGDLEGLKRAALQATFLNVNDHWPIPEPICPSGNCDYPVYRSLGLCVSMQNVTSALTYDEFEKQSGFTMVRASLLNDTVFMEDELTSNTMALNATSLQPRIRLADYDRPVTSQMDFEEAQEAMDKAMEKYVWPPEWTSVADWEENPDVLDATIAQFFFIWSTAKGLDKDMHTRYRAAEVLWHFCVHEYNTTARDGVAATESLGSVVKVDEVVKQRGDPCYFMLTDAGGQDRFRITDSYTYSELDRMFRRAFSGAWSFLDFDMDYSEISAQIAESLFLNEYEYGTDGWSRQTLEEWDVIMWDNLGKITATVAQGFTAHMRKMAKVDSDIEGDVLQTETFVVVRWPWLSALAAQIGLSIVFVVSVAVHTARLGVAVVRSNNLAELFAQDNSRSSREEQDDGVPGGGTAFSTGIKTQVDEAVRGRLVRDNEAWILQMQKDGTSEAKPPGDSISGSSS